MKKIGNKTKDSGVAQVQFFNISFSLTACTVLCRSATFTYQLVSSLNDKGELVLLVHYLQNNTVQVPAKYIESILKQILFGYGVKVGPGLRDPDPASKYKSGTREVRKMVLNQAQVVKIRLKNNRNILG